MRRGQVNRVNPLLNSLESKSSGCHEENPSALPHLADMPVDGRHNIFSWNLRQFAENKFIVL